MGVDYLHLRLRENLFFFFLTGGMPMAQEILGAVFQRMLLSLSMSVHQIGMLPNLMTTLVKVPSTVFRMSMVCSTDHILAAVSDVNV